MDDASLQLLAQLIRTQRVASLGTLRDGSPFVSMVLYAPRPISVPIISTPAGWRITHKTSSATRASA